MDCFKILAATEMSPVGPLYSGLLSRRRSLVTLLRRIVTQTLEAGYSAVCTRTPRRRAGEWRGITAPYLSAYNKFDATDMFTLGDALTAGVTSCMIHKQLRLECPGPAFRMNAAYLASRLFALFNRSVYATIEQSDFNNAAQVFVRDCRMKAHNLELTRFMSFDSFSIAINDRLPANNSSTRR